MVRTRDHAFPQSGGDLTSLQNKLKEYVANMKTPGFSWRGAKGEWVRAHGCNKSSVSGPARKNTYFAESMIDHDGKYLVRIKYGNQVLLRFHMPEVTEKPPTNDEVLRELRKQVGL
ncbi:hypothetical protein K491DRAFT_742087 [Lophiostoma macrostomum CBS 122681]|uniref:Uncharacterized protein n=1 Tax=Lophiostoma macrostomum CBS 122681 TaxID=1314788 RepID=A0A6A6TCB2_9PLEO|nr:hypothetical protein K491DRAFT_742087 [Lophiostoma macrostomum CBS 122681]